MIDTRPTPNRVVMIAVLAVLAFAFAGILGLNILRETAGTNSYALLADGWLHGRLDTDHCGDQDCALFEGKTFIIFPPLPGVIALPFVALFGPDFNAFIPLTALAFALSGWLWWRMARHETLEVEPAALICLLVLFATPLYFVMLRGDRVWFFAQSWSFLFSSAAIYFALVRQNALVTGLFIALAFLSRQMTILYLPFLYVLLLNRETPLLRIDMAAMRRVCVLMVFPAAALAVYLGYNYARFGAPLETGYSYIFPQIWDGASSTGTFLRYRVRELGIFSEQYFLFNAVYMFFAGPHVEFTGRYMTELARFDINGASPFLVAPVLLLAFLAKWDRSFWIGLGCVSVILGATLFYHSNGFSQYSAQRYALDWLPILLVFLLRGVRPSFTAPLAILTAYAMAVTLGMIAIGGMLAS